MARDRVLYVVGVFALLLALTGCQSGRSAEPTPTFIPTPIVPASPEYVAQRGEVVRELEFTGRVTPVKTETLYFEIDGRVRQVYVTRNQWVEEGTIIAELDSEDLLNQLELAQLSLQTAQNALEAAVRDYEQSRSLAEINLRTAELQLAMAVAQDTEPDVTLAQINLEQATAALKEAQEEYDKALNRPWERPDVLEGYKSWLDDAQWAYREAQALYDRALQQGKAYDYQVALLREAVRRAQLELEWLEIGVDPALTQTVQSAQVVVDGFQAQVNRARVVAPFDGRVLSLGISEATQVRAFHPVVTLAGQEGLEVTANLSQRDLLDVAIGMTATVELANAPGQVIPAEVRMLPRMTGPVEDRDPAIHIRLLKAEGLDLEIDDLTTVRIILGERHDVLWLPPEAIRIYEGRRFVVVREGETQRRADVTIGVIGKERVEILEGLEEGRIVIAP